MLTNVKEGRYDKIFFYEKVIFPRNGLDTDVRS